MEKMKVRFDRCKGCGLCVRLSKEAGKTANRKAERKRLLHCGLHRSGCVYQLCNVCNDVSGLCNPD